MILFKSTYRNKLADRLKQKVVMMSKSNPVKVRATSKAATRDLMNCENRIALGMASGFTCLFAKMHFSVYSSSLN